MLLGLACGNTFMDTSDHSMPGTLCTVSPDVVNIAKQAFYDFGERPIWTERVTYGTSKFYTYFPSQYMTTSHL
jgi:nuclear pore complex protein Nup155